MSFQFPRVSSSAVGLFTLLGCETLFCLVTAAARRSDRLRNGGAMYAFIPSPFCLVVRFSCLISLIYVVHTLEQPLTTAHRRLVRSRSSPAILWHAVPSRVAAGGENEAGRIETAIL